ncbi:MAG: TA system VapC family ribonuclease toxin [Acidobacteriota bacterium]
MIAVDTNILVYAHREEMSKHGAARDRLTRLAEGAERWCIPVFCMGEFLRILTHPRLFDPPYSSQEGLEAVERVLASPSLVILNPGPDHVRLLVEAILESDATGNLVFDAQIVALCREAGVRSLLTEDRDFDRFRNFPTEHLR